MAYISNTANGKNSPHSDKPAFIKVDHWLTDDESHTLRDAVRPYIERPTPLERSDTFEDAFRRAMPKRILSEMEQLVDEPDAPVIHVIHNLPMTPMAEIEEERRTIAAKPQQESGSRSTPAAEEDKHWRNWINENTYAGAITEGISMALSLRDRMSAHLVRRSAAQRIKGGELHRDSDWNISAIAGVLTDGSPTRYVDWKAVLSEAMAQGLGSVNLEVNHGTLPLDEVAETYKSNPRLIKQIAISNPDNEEGKKLNDLIKSYSYNIVIGPQDVVVSSNRSRILHQGLPSPHVAEPAGAVSRLAATCVASSQSV